MKKNDFILHIFIVIVSTTFCINMIHKRINGHDTIEGFIIRWNIAIMDTANNAADLCQRIANRHNYFWLEKFRAELNAHVADVSHLKLPVYQSSNTDEIVKQFWSSSETCIECQTDWWTDRERKGPTVDSWLNRKRLHDHIN